MIDIPAEWQQLHWKQQVALAEQLTGDPTINEASKARAIIEAEVRKRANAARAPERVEPEVPAEAPTVPLKLLRDTWQGTTRIRADGTVTNWALADAKRLIAEGVGERADPLPGE